MSLESSWSHGMARTFTESVFVYSSWIGDLCIAYLSIWLHKNLRVCLSKNQPRCPRAKIFFLEIGSRHYGKVPRDQKTRSRPLQGPAGAVFRFQGCTTLFHDDFCFLFFPYMFRHICQGIHLNLPDSAQKKFWRPNFLKILTFYLVKSKPLALTRRVKKSTLLHTQCYIWHQNMKQNFISDLLIPFFSGLGPQKASGAIFPFFPLNFCIFYRFCRRKSRQVYSHTPGALKIFCPHHWTP